MGGGGSNEMIKPIDLIWVVVSQPLRAFETLASLASFFLVIIIINFLPYVFIKRTHNWNVCFSHAKL